MHLKIGGWKSYVKSLTWKKDRVGALTLRSQGSGNAKR